MNEVSEQMKLADPDAKVNSFKVSHTEWYTATKRGLVHVIINDEGGNSVTKLTFSPVEILGFLEPIDGDVDRGLQIKVGDKSVTVRRAEVSKRDQLTTWLADHGVRFDPNHIAKITRYFMLWHGGRITGYTHNGWQSNGAFVAGETILGGDGCVIETRNNRLPFKQVGSFDEWRENVLPHIAKKPGWIFSLLIGLSSPILEVVGAASGTTFNLSGMSSTGKTDALRVAVSAWGRPAVRGVDACVQSLRTTVNGIESVAVQSNHVCLCFDEMKSADVEILREGAYLLSNGRGKIRAKPDGSAREVASWLVNVLMCGEKTVEGILDAAGVAQAAGQVLRWIDVNSDPLLPKLSMAELRDFYAALDRYYGTAGPALVQRILDGFDVHTAFDAAAVWLYQGEDAKLQRASYSFAALIVAGEIMDINTEVVKEVWDRWIDEDVSKAMDDFQTMGSELLAFIDEQMGAMIVELEEADENGEDWGGTGEAGRSYSGYKGWYRVEGLKTVAYLRAEAFKPFFTMGRNKCYAWLGAHLIIAQKRGQYTMPTPVLKRNVMTVRVDVDVLRKVVE